ncbi:MAG TPA: transcriptional repressor [Solirubrobacteraceae bacterium]|nr:transcriptional repressor [Solirubrobacteraceae bacterium]
MTLAPDAAPTFCATVEEALALLRERGLRVSTSRRLVLERLFEVDRPVSAERLSGDLRLDLASVYRNLEALERQGLVRHVHLGHGPGLYALLAHGEREYLYCERCHTLTAVAPSRLDEVRALLAERFGYRVRFSHFPITGTCPACDTGGAQPTAG